jgi:hypothetical protein
MPPLVMRFLSSWIAHALVLNQRVRLTPAWAALLIACELTYAFCNRAAWHGSAVRPGVNLTSIS